MADRELGAVFHCVQYWSMHENCPETVQKELEDQEKTRKNHRFTGGFVPRMH